MNKDEERYKICLQCVGENIDRSRGTVLYSHNEILKSIAQCIESDIKGKKKWENEFSWPGLENQPDEVCSWCPYVLEHLVLENES